MFGINLNPVNLVATAALGPLGGIASQLISQLASNIGQQIIQQLGQNLGLPQSTIDLAQGAFAGSMGDVGGLQSNLNQVVESIGQQLGATPAQIGEAQRDMDQSISDFVSQLSEGQESKEARAGGGSGGWLMAIATKLGKELDKMADDLDQMAGQLSKDDPSMTAQFGALSQQFGMMFNATSTAIKAIGEAMSGMARKQ